jgi:hypothetical protein
MVRYLPECLAKNCAQEAVNLPGRLFQLPFLSEQDRRNILGEAARKLFNL